MAKKICGLYKIINTINGHFYVGSTYDFRVRRNRHIFNLRREKRKDGRTEKSPLNIGRVYLNEHELIGQTLLKKKR